MKNFTMFILLSFCVCFSIDSKWQKQAVMLVIESDIEIDTVFPIDSNWSVFAVDVNDAAMLRPGRVKQYKEMAELAGFEVMRVLLYNEVVNIPTQK